MLAAVFFLWHSCLLFTSWIWKIFYCCYGRVPREVITTDHPFLLPLSDFYFWFKFLAYDIGFINVLQKAQLCSTLPNQCVLSAKVTASWEPTTHEYCKYVLTQNTVSVEKIGWRNHLCLPDWLLRMIFPISFSLHLSPLLFFSFYSLLSSNTHS